MGYADWYKVSAANYTCNQHPKPKKELVKMFAAHLHTSELHARHVLDRLRHLSYCLDEQEAITLLRLQQGTKQQMKRIDQANKGKSTPDA